MKKARKKDGGGRQLVSEELKISGMSCRGCEQIIEKQAKSLNGVEDIKADFRTGSGKVTYDPSQVDLDAVLRKINEKGYLCGVGKSASSQASGVGGIALVLGVAVVLIAAYSIVQGRFEFSLPSIGQDVSTIMLFIVGLFTGFHCIAMCGGFVVSYTSKQAAEGGGLNLGSHLAYGFAKTLSYTVIGAFFGFVGSYLTFTPFLRGAAAILAGLFLVLFGLNMLGIFGWFRAFRLKTPAFIKEKASRLQRKNSSPLVIGLLNGLMIACGPLQAIYLLAAASGSAYYGGLYLFAFGLGTLPVLLGFGLLTSLVSSQLTRRILKFSGMAVILLGLVMLNRGLSLTGAGYDVKSLSVSAVTPAPAPSAGLPSDNTTQATADGYQEIHMDVTAAGWNPDTFVLKKGVPVKWIINGKQITNCNKAIQVPKLGLRFDIKPGLQTIEFTPTEAGVIPWSCWMGMIDGTFVVEDD